MKVSRISLLTTALAVIISFVALILTIIASQFSRLSPVSGRAVTYEGDIRITIDGSDAGVSKTPVSLYGLKPFAQLSYSLTVPEYVIAGDTAAIRMNSAKFSVFLDGVLLYSYIPDASESGRPEYGYGTTFYIPLADDAAGKELRIDAIEAATNGGIRLAYVEFGDFASMEVETLFMEIEPVIVSFMIVFMACIAFITCFFSRESDTRRSLLSSACLLLILALWILFQSRSRQYIISNTALPASVSYFCIFFLPYSLYKYFIYNYPLSHGRRLRFFHYLSVFFIACYCVIGLLSLTGVCGFMECLTPATTFVLSYTAAFFAYVCYLFSRHERVGLFLIITSIMIVSFLIEWILLFFGISLLTPLTLEVLAFSTLAILFRSLSLFLLETKERAEKEAILTLAYRDPLTGLRNRASYDALLRQSWHGERYLDVFVIDVNDLKVINDEKGHSEGNVLLRTVAEVLLKTFPYPRELGYRTGGDEFVVFSPSVAERDTRAVCSAIKEKLSVSYGKSMVSIGCVSVDTRKISLSEAVNKADMAMYADKKSNKNS